MEPFFNSVSKTKHIIFLTIGILITTLNHAWSQVYKENSNLGLLGGKVWLDANANNQFDTGEKGIEGVKIQLWKKGGKILEKTTLTKKDGSYAFEGLELGEYQVSIDKEYNFGEDQVLYKLTNCKGSGDPNALDNTDDNGTPGASSHGGLAGSVISAPVFISGKTLQRGKYKYGDENYFASENGIDWIEKSDEGRSFNFTCYATDLEFVYLKAHLLLKLPRDGGQCLIRYTEEEEWQPLYWTEKEITDDPFDKLYVNGTVDFGFQSVIEIPSEMNRKGVLADYSNFKVPVNGNPQTMTGILSDWSGSPKSAYGIIPSIDFRTNSDNTIDVLWIETNGVKRLSRISLENGDLVEEIQIPSKVATGRFLGFEKLAKDRFIIGYAKENSYGQENTEAWYTAFEKSGKELFSTRIWGEMNKNKLWSKGDPGGASTALIRYSKKHNVIFLYMGHDMKWDDNVRHQGGWVGFLDGNTGQILKNGDEIIGDQWFFSHNFDQRGILSSEDKFYTLAHGDAYPRALGIHRWSHNQGQETGLNYFDIKSGRVGDNETLSHTGDLVELADGNVAIVYSTEIKRKERDLRLAIVSGMPDDDPKVIHETWLTENSDNNFVGWGSRIIPYKDKLLVAWNEFSDGMPNGSKFALVSPNGKVQSSVEKLEETVLYPSQSFQTTKDGENIVFVSSDGGSLKIHLIKIK